MREDPTYAGVPVFVVSGDSSALQRLRPAVAGVFLKPADPEVLVATLADASVDGTSRLRPKAKG
jgi:hypothetical protein